MDLTRYLKIQSDCKNMTTKGKVYLVGAGPGDPGLITVKGLECIQKADVIIYDYLASLTLLKHTSQKAEMIYVGKKGSDHTLAQNEINELIVEKAKAGLIVTRLKGGDPFIFGRGGEEAEVLIDEGIPFEIVPGVTSNTTRLMLEFPSHIEILHQPLHLLQVMKTRPKKEQALIGNLWQKGLGLLCFSWVLKICRILFISSFCMA